MTKLVILPPAARYLKKLNEKPLKEIFQADGLFNHVL